MRNGYNVSITSQQMKTINPQHRFCGVCLAASEAKVTRQHIYLCLVGRRNPSEKVAKAIEKHVTVFTQTPVAG